MLSVGVGDDMCSAYTASLMYIGNPKTGSQSTYQSRTSKECVPCCLTLDYGPFGSRR